MKILKVIEVKQETIELNKKITLAIFTIIIGIILIIMEFFIVIRAIDIFQNIYDITIRYEWFLLILIISNLLFFALGYLIRKYW